MSWKSAKRPAMVRRKCQEVSVIIIFAVTMMSIYNVCVLVFASARNNVHSCDNYRSGNIPHSFRNHVESSARIARLRSASVERHRFH